MGQKDNDSINSVAEAKSASVAPSSKNYYLPKIVLCLLSHLDAKPQLEEMLNEAKVDYEFGERDARMEETFRGVEFGTRPSLKREDFEAIADHSLVLYILSNGYPKASAFQASTWFLLFGCKLLEAGAVAMKCESSGIAHSRARWLSLAETCKRNFSNHPEVEIGDAVAGLYTALFEAYVQYPIGSAKDYWSCGMHLLGQADVIISTDLVKKALANSDSPLQDVAYLFNAFCLYILGESSESHFESGGIFHPDSEFPSLKVVWEECEGYPEDDLYFNPYGRWRFSSISE